METNDLLVKTLGFQKETFEKTYNYYVNLQEQVDQKLNTFVEGTAFFPEPVKQFYKQWTQNARNSRETLKKYADEGYQGIEKYFETTH